MGNGEGEPKVARGMGYSATRPTVASQTKFLTTFWQVSQSDSEIVLERTVALSMWIEPELIFDRKTTDSATDFLQ